MKKMYFSYNKFTNEYYLDEGSFSKNRRAIKYEGSKKILEKFLKKANPKRRTDLFVDSQIPKDVMRYIEIMFKGTKVNLKLEDL